MFRWKPIDTEYQKALDTLAEELLDKSLHELHAWPDYGNLTRSINGVDETIGFWHYKFSNESHHIVFIAGRRTGLIFHRKYISGVVFGSSTDPRLMTSEEIGDYD